MTILLVKFNTPIFLGAGVKRLFSLGKEVLRPVRAGLSGTQFPNVCIFEQKSIIVL